MRSAPDDLAVAIRTLLLDHAAATAVTSLDEKGVGSVLLKGAVLASWLYEGEIRPYGDVDLLVDPGNRDLAARILADDGYRHRLEGAADSEIGAYEIELVKPGGACIDLHHSLLGVSAGPARCWEVLSRRTVSMVVGGATVQVLDEPSRAMHLALHVAQNGPIDRKAVDDLERGLRRLPVELWRDAVDVARELDALEALSGGLRVTEAGTRLADRLGVAPPRDVALLLRIASAPQEALQIQNLVEADSLGRRLRLVGRKLWPTTAYMRTQLPGQPAAPLALVVARLVRIAGLPAKFAVALRSWRHARQTSRRSASVDPAATTRRLDR